MYDNDIGKKSLKQKGTLKSATLNLLDESGLSVLLLTGFMAWHVREHARKHNYETYYDRGKRDLLG